MNNKKGFTLVEVLVAVFIFVLIVLIITSIVSNSIRVQRHNLAHRDLMDQTSYLMEYISRHIRMAKRQTSDMSHTCLSVGESYGVSAGNDSIQFIHYKHEVESAPILVCTKFSLHSYVDGGGVQRKRLKQESRIMMNPGAGSLVFEEYLTSTSLLVDTFNVFVDNPTEQPLVRINDLIITGRENTKIAIQTSISQRDLNLY